MSRLKLSDEDLKILNSRIGLKHLFRQDGELDYNRAINEAKYELKLRSLQAELVHVQNWVMSNKKKIVIIFEGRDAAGKGGAINRITAHINPRHFRALALPKPSAEEKGQWYFQRFVNRLPRPGEMVFFDRSWYNRAVVEPVNGFCTKKEYDTFMGQVNEFERMLLESEIILIKFFLKISKEEQNRRLEQIKNSPLKRWQLSPVDAKAQELWDKYTQYEEKMFKHSNTKNAPWIIIDGETREKAIISPLQHILKTIPYKK